MITVPYDVWLHITSHLSKDEIWRLRFVSHELYDIAMDSRYGTVNFPVNFKKNTRYIHNFVRFRNPNVAERVRNIAYFSHAATAFPGKWKPKTAPGSIKNRFQTLFTKSSPTAQDVVETMAGFTNVVSLNMRFLLFDEDHHFEDCLPLVHTNFRTCFAQLQSLVLYSPLRTFSIIFFPDLFFPCLNSLTMTFFGPTEELSLKNVATTTILPFINRHRRTLNTVFFHTISGTTQTLDNSSLYEGLDHIPSLRKTFVSITSSTQPASVARFLEMHRDTLRVIKIGLMDRPYKLVDDIFQVITGDFLMLEVFSVHFMGFRQTPSGEQSLDITTDFVKRCSSSLVSLGLMAGAHSAKKLHELLNPRGRQDVSFGRLKYLYISIRALTPDILDFLASRLPNLYSLDMFSTGMKCRETLPDIVLDHYEFSLEMARRNYSSWNLQHLTLHFETMGRATNSTGPMSIARAIPSLKTYNGINLSSFRTAKRD